MKILLINKFHYYKGGSETYYFGLADLLRSHGHEVIFFSMKDDQNVPCDQEKFFVENVDFNKPMNKLQMAKAGFKMLYSLEAKKKLEELILVENPDIAHLNIFQSQLTGSIVDVLYKHHIPMVYTMHDLKALCPCYTMLTHGEVCERCINGNFMNCIKHKCMKDSTAKSILATMESYIYRIDKTYQKIDYIITPSEFYKKKLEEANITKAKIVHMKNFLPQGIEYTEEITIGDYFLYFGRLSQEKGILTLIEAYKLSNVKNDLYIVGTGPIEEEIKNKIHEYNLTDKVQMLGYKTGKELQDIVKNCRCVILPSEWYENGPYTIMESQAAGKPVIVSSNGGLPEVVKEGINGFITLPNNPKELGRLLIKMEKLSKQQLLMMGKKARNTVTEISDIKKYFEKLNKVYLYVFNK